MAGFIDQINELRDWAGRDAKIKLVREWMDKMWEDGVSAMADISNDDSSFEVKKDHKMYTRTFLEVFGSEPHMCEGVMQDVMKLSEIADQAGIDAAPTPHSCYTMSPQLLSASAAAGLEKSADKWKICSGSRPIAQHWMMHCNCGKIPYLCFPPCCITSGWMRLGRILHAAPEPFGQAISDNVLHKLIPFCICWKIFVNMTISIGKPCFNCIYFPSFPHFVRRAVNFVKELS